MDGASRCGCILAVARRIFFVLLAVAVAVVSVILGLKERASLRQGGGFNIPPSLAASNVLITGASSGIGYATAVIMCRMNANVMLHGPSPRRTSRALQELRDGSPDACTSAATAAELDDYGQVHKMAEHVRRVFPQIHVLLLNAGLHYGGPPTNQWQIQRMRSHKDSDYVSKHGQDRAMAVNHFGHFLLTMLLLPSLAPDARIVLVTGGGMWSGDWRRVVTPRRVPWERFRLKGHLAYFDSKLANLCMARSLRQRLPEATVVVNEPGHVTTTMTLGRETPLYGMRRFVAAKSKEPWYRQMWYMSSVEAAERLVQTTFLTKPVPDVAYNYWVPPELMWLVQDRSHVQTARSFSRRGSWHFFFLKRQAMWFGPLYAGIGPGCGDEEFLAFHWNYSLVQVGLGSPEVKAYVEAYRRDVLRGTPPPPELPGLQLR